MTEQVKFEDEKFDQATGLRTASLQQEMLSQLRTPLLVRIVLRLRIVRTRDQARNVLVALAVAAILVAVYFVKSAVTPHTITYLKLN